MINKPPPFKGLNIRILNIIPIEGRGFINHGFGLVSINSWISTVLICWDPPPKQGTFSQLEGASASRSVLGAFPNKVPLILGNCHFYFSQRIPKRAALEACLPSGIQPTSSTAYLEVRCTYNLLSNCSYDSRPNYI